SRPTATVPPVACPTSAAARSESPTPLPPVGRPSPTHLLRPVPPGSDPAHAPPRRSGASRTPRGQLPRWSRLLLGPLALKTPPAHPPSGSRAHGPPPRPLLGDTLRFPLWGDPPQGPYWVPDDRPQSIPEQGSWWWTVGA